MEKNEKIVTKEELSSEILNNTILDRLTRSFLRKIRENESSDKKENLKNKFREILEKEKF